MTTLEDLKALGGVVPDAPVAKEIAFKIDGQEYTATIYVRKLSIGDHEKLFANDEGDYAARLISHAVRLGDGGKESISFQDAYQLHPSLAEAMMNAIKEVNGGKKS